MSPDAESSTNQPNLTRRQREIIELLLKRGVVTQEHLGVAREEIKRTGLSMPAALEKLGFITEEDIVKVRADALAIPYMDLADYVVDAQLVKLIPENIARKFRVVPLFRIGNSLSVGMVDPLDFDAADQLRQLTKVELVEPVLVSEKGIQKVIDVHYGAGAGAGTTLDDLVHAFDKEEGGNASGKGLAEIAGEAPVVKLVNILISRAVTDHASDIHVEPEERGLRVRCRIDGLLRETAVLPKKVQNGIISRIKILAKMDIAETRKPQDGRIRIKIDEKEVDLRVSTFPTLHGENVVLRLLDKAAVLLGLKDVGLFAEDLAAFEKLIRRANGIILVTGPTGSGKTSTLYAAMTSINSIEKNIITIEDPVEYELPLIRQTQVNPKAGITFATGLRSILRQDPDIIMVGEIRDRETADVAIQAALTGHLVLATLHTNDAPSALTRLIDMGVEPFLVSSAVCGILAQRLVRVTCERCKQTYQPSEAVLQDVGLPDGAKLMRGAGCPKCQGSGFSGRMGIFELMVLDEELRRMVEGKASSDELKRKAVAKGMKTLRENGLAKVRDGTTTPEEVLRVTEVES